MKCQQPQQYEFDANFSSNFFLQGAGLITIAQPLDYNKSKFYKLSVNALDSGGRFDTATVNINVTDSNNNAPRLVFAT